MALDKTAVLNATCKYGVIESAGAQVSTNRVALVWTDDGAGGSQVSGTEAFTGPPNEAADAVGFYSAQSGGTYYGNAPTTGAAAFNSDGAYNVTALAISA